jgi:signal transduction histidine kinase
MGKTRKLTKLERELLAEKEFHAEINAVLAHDLRKPVGIIDMYAAEMKKILDEVKNPNCALTREERLAKYEFLARQCLEPILSATRVIVNDTRILDLSGVSAEELAKESQRFKPLSQIKEVFDVFAHDAVRRGKGLCLYYKNEDNEKEIKTNSGAFTTVFSNLLSNAIQYANKSSNIRARVNFKEDNFLFDIENEIPKLIDVEDLRELYKKGYRLHGTEEGSLFTRNEGLGAYFVNKVVRKGFLGHIEVKSDADSRINQIRFKDYQKIEYAPEYLENQGDIPLFYSRVVIPIKKLESLATNSPKSIEDFVREE